MSHLLLSQETNAGMRQGYILLMGTIECPANGGKRQGVRVNKVAALPLWLKLLLKGEKLMIPVRVAKVMSQEVDTRSHKGFICGMNVAQGSET